MGLLYGIADGDGRVATVERPFLDVFPEYADLRGEPARLKILVDHALTMTMGVEWDEMLPYSDPRNGERQMDDAPDRYRFVLERPIVAPPGTRWTYTRRPQSVRAPGARGGAARVMRVDGDAQATA